MHENKKETDAPSIDGADKGNLRIPGPEPSPDFECRRCKYRFYCLSVRNWKQPRPGCYYVGWYVENGNKLYKDTAIEWNLGVIRFGVGWSCYSNIRAPEKLKVYNPFVMKREVSKSNTVDSDIITVKTDNYILERNKEGIIKVLCLCWELGPLAPREASKFYIYDKFPIAEVFFNDIIGFLDHVVEVYRSLIWGTKDGNEKNYDNIY